MVKISTVQRRRLGGLLLGFLTAALLISLVACSAAHPASDHIGVAAAAPDAAGQAASGQPAILPQTGADAPKISGQAAAGLQTPLPPGARAAVPVPAATLGPGHPAAPAPAQPDAAAPVGRRISIVVLGVDNRPTENLGRSDTILVLTFDPKTGSSGLISLTRDLLVTIPGLPFRAKINTANYYGDLYKMPGGGPELLRKTASAFLGYPIDYWVRVNFDGFREIIDRIGGIDIYVPTAIDDPQFPDDTYGYDPLYIPAGLIHMDGTLALKYVRTRHEDSDYGRVRRQQQVIRAVSDKVLRPGNLGLLPQLPGLALTLSRSIQTNMPVGQIIAVLGMLDQKGHLNPTGVVIDDQMGTIGTDPIWGWVLIPDMNKVHAAAAKVFAGR